MTKGAGVKGGDKVYHRGGGIVYHRHDEKELNWEPGGVRSGVNGGGMLGHWGGAPSTLGTFLRSFRWGHVRQLDRVSRQLLARAWAAGAGPGDSPLTIDLDSTICETYGLAKEGALV